MLDPPPCICRVNAAAVAVVVAGGSGIAMPSSVMATATGSVSAPNFGGAVGATGTFMGGGAVTGGLASGGVVMQQVWCVCANIST